MQECSIKLKVKPALWKCLLAQIKYVFSRRKLYWINDRCLIQFMLLEIIDSPNNISFFNNEPLCSYWNESFYFKLNTQFSKGNVYFLHQMNYFICEYMLTFPHQPTFQPSTTKFIKQLKNVVFAVKINNVLSVPCCFKLKKHTKR